jgi:hypothetical protein
LAGRSRLPTDKLGGSFAISANPAIYVPPIFFPTPSLSTSSLLHFFTSSLRHFFTSSLRHFFTSSLLHFFTIFTVTEN